MQARHRWTSRVPWISAGKGLVCLLLIGLTGCGLSPSAHRHVIRKAPLSAPQPANANAYRVDVGDVLELHAAGNRPVRAEVSLDGDLHLSESPSIHVAGMSCDEIEETLSGDLRVRVRVADYRSQHVLVAGLRGKALRPVPYRGPEPVEELIDRLGCPDCPNGYRVRVVRPSRRVGGEPLIFSTTIDNKGQADRAHETIRLQAGDYVYVEKDIGHKGPVTLMTDQQFFSSSMNLFKQVRLAQASNEMSLKR
jgi:protein involved in polysaccharide export with SLBB domain